MHGKVNEVFKANAELASKPLFFVKTIDLLLEDLEFSVGVDLLDTLTHRFLEREQKENFLTGNIDRCWPNTISNC